VADGIHELARRLPGSFANSSKPQLPRLHPAWPQKPLLNTRHKPGAVGGMRTGELSEPMAEGAAGFSTALPVRQARVRLRPDHFRARRVRCRSCGSILLAGHRIKRKAVLQIPECPTIDDLATKRCLCSCSELVGRCFCMLLSGPLEIEPVHNQNGNFLVQCSSVLARIILQPSADGIARVRAT